MQKQPIIRVLFAQNGEQGRYYSDKTRRTLETHPRLRVIICTDAGQVLDHAELDEVDFDILVTDSCLEPSSKLDRKATQNGQATGMELYRYIRKCGKTRLPLVIFTTQDEERERMSKLTDPCLMTVKAEEKMDQAIMEIIRRFFHQIMGDGNDSHSGPLSVPADWGNLLAEDDHFMCPHQA